MSEMNQILFCRSNPIAPDPGVEKEACPQTWQV
jgi:hypothetical protein